MLVTAMDHSHQQRRLSLAMMNSHHQEVAPEYFESVHAPSYTMSLNHSHSMNLGNPHYMDEHEDEYDVNVSPKNNAKPSLYKTELCKRFSEYGSCRYGAKCQFAHGMPELRHVLRHPKYKTTKCKSYWGSGHCPYGSRCRFIHEEEVYPKSSCKNSLSPRNELSPTGQGNLSFLNSEYGEIPSATSGIISGFTSELGMAQGPPVPQNWMANESTPPNFIRKPSDTYPSKSSPIGTKKSQSIGHGHDNGVEYNGIQDAIEVLMKFSTFPEGESPPSTSSPEVGLPPSNFPSLKSPLKHEMSLQADELWKDFSSCAISSGETAEQSEWSQFDAMGNESREDSSRLSFFTKFK